MKQFLLMAAAVVILAACNRSVTTPDIKDTPSNPFIGLWQSSFGENSSYKFNSDNTFEHQVYTYGASGFGQNEKLLSSAYTETGRYEYSEETGIFVMIFDEDILDPVTSGKSSVIRVSGDIYNYLVLTEPFTIDSKVLTMTNMSDFSTFSWSRKSELSTPASIKGQTLSSNEYPDVSIEFISDTECLIKNSAYNLELPPAPYKYVQYSWGSFLTSDRSDDKRWDDAVTKWIEDNLDNPVISGIISEQRYYELCYGYGDMLSLFSAVKTTIDDEGKYYLYRWKFADPGHFTIRHGDYGEIWFSGTLQPSR